jgi:hypothetical protein
MKVAHAFLARGVLWGGEERARLNHLLAMAQGGRILGVGLEQRLADPAEGTERKRGGEGKERGGGGLKLKVRDKESPRGQQA